MKKESRSFRRQCQKTPAFVNSSRKYNFSDYIRRSPRKNLCKLAFIFFCAVVYFMYTFTSPLRANSRRHGNYF